MTAEIFSKRNAKKTLVANCRKLPNFATCGNKVLQTKSRVSILDTRLFIVIVVLF